MTDNGRPNAPAIMISIRDELTLAEGVPRSASSVPAWFGALLRVTVAMLELRGETQVREALPVLTSCIRDELARRSLDEWELPESLEEEFVLVATGFPSSGDEGRRRRWAQAACWALAMLLMSNQPEDTDEGPDGLKGQLVRGLHLFTEYAGQDLILVWLPGSTGVTPR